MYNLGREGLADWRPDMENNFLLDQPKQCAKWKISFRAFTQKNHELIWWNLKFSLPLLFLIIPESWWLKIAKWSEVKWDLMTLFWPLGRVVVPIHVNFTFWISTPYLTDYFEERRGTLWSIYRYCFAKKFRYNRGVVTIFS